MSAALHGQESRVVHYAVLASIVLHGLVLFSFPIQDAGRRSAATSAPIVARLVPPQPAPVAAKPEPVAPAPVEKPPPAAVKPAPPAKAPPVTKAAPRTPSPAPVPAAPAAPAPPAPAAVEPAPAVPAPQSSAPPTPSAPQAAAPAARPSVEVDADSLGRFRLQVIDATGRYKRYPPAAIDNNWEGRAYVRVSFGADGRRSSIVVVRSSGHEILDKAAVDMVGKTSVPVPPALRGKAFAFEFPVDFNLKDARSG